MFFNKGTKEVFWIEIILPKLVLLFALPAIYYFNGPGGDLTEFFYFGAWITGLVSILVEAGIGITTFVMMIISMFQKTRVQYHVSRKLVLWVSALSGIFETVFFLLMLQIFTYAQSV